MSTDPNGQNGSKRWSSTPSSAAAAAAAEEDDINEEQQLHYNSPTSTPRKRNPPPQVPVLSLHDVLAAHPAEDPSETKLLRNLEEGNIISRSRTATMSPRTSNESSPISQQQAPPTTTTSSPLQIPTSRSGETTTTPTGVRRRNNNNRKVTRMSVEDELAHLARQTSAAATSDATTSTRTTRITSAYDLSQQVATNPHLNSFERDAATLMSRAATPKKKGGKNGSDSSVEEKIKQEDNNNDEKRDPKQPYTSDDNSIPPDLLDDDNQDLMILKEFKDFMAFRKRTILGTLRAYVLYSLIPFGGLAAFLFYVFPKTTEVNDESKATVSWWLLFIGVRQVFTLLCAKFTEDVCVNFLAVKTRAALNAVGPFFTLMIVQSKGWTFQLFMWAVIDFSVLYGDSRFARHWLFFTNDFVELFSSENSAGTVLESHSYYALLVAALVLSSAIAMKRFFLGLWYGRSVYKRYGKDLANVMKKILLIQSVAELAHDKHSLRKGRLLHVDRGNLVGGDGAPSDFDRHDDHGKSSPNGGPNGNSTIDVGSWVGRAPSSIRNMWPEPSKRSFGDNYSQDPSVFDVSTSKFIIDTTARENFAGAGLNISQRLKIAELLGEWEEPVTGEHKVEETASISAVVNFRAAMSVIDHEYPFSRLFGMAGTREECIDSSQRLFLRLDAEDGDKDYTLQFDLLAAVALNKYGGLDEEKLRFLIEVFRPTRKGELTMLEFVKSIDSVYKELRILEASVENANKMNAASQEIIDSIYHFIVACITLAILGIDTLALLGSITAVVVGLAFMIGGATSNWFEGMLFMLVRRPFDIGDRVAVSAADSEVSDKGSFGWIVKDVTLYYTTVIFSQTMEEATYSNFALAPLRIINHNRSPKAFLHFYVRVGIATPKEKIQKFAAAVKAYVKERPREWLSFTAFRMNTVQVEMGYAEYKILMVHRESWQQIGAILNSKADIQMYSYELSKALGIDYENPPMPIILRTQLGAETDEPKDVDVARMLDPRSWKPLATVKRGAGGDGD